ncbi:peptidase C39 [Pseudoduganella sp. FT93W]|uniref:Peptidase C39 n=1 Tax=Duganella fentianensis TaxID=2692177 RepID=A0A845I2H6_9BURK|nr:peptidase C39 [Duganella fentianensis]
MKTPALIASGLGLLLFCGSMLTAGAADLALPGGGSVAVAVTDMKAARFLTTVHQQADFSCGSAALATLLTFHYGRPTTEQQVFDIMYAQGDQQRIRRQGFSLLDMQRLLASQGLIADGYQQPLDKLEQAGLPAIVRIVEQGYAHFVVIKGIQGGRILLGDPASGTRAMSRVAFERIWQDGLLFVIHEWPGQPRFNLATDWRVVPQVRLAGAVSDVIPAMSVLPKTGSGNF